ncbi:hypothetical protein NQ314_001568 [Rhamnusium bicolor]|uniref:acid phosphatase n=1 Tax=Rhamnusium bicolor TaxID=1586634 RepID=A0AAV8ZT27_9CUCU|nr:hypothetical protein NQ314_001568 [Rhamnusium bicolor]
MLLLKGKERQYELGTWFRKRYTNFLPEEYSPNSIRVISTDVDRTLTSAASNLAGLFPHLHPKFGTKTYFGSLYQYILLR